MNRNVLIWILAVVAVILLGVLGFYSCERQGGGKKSSLSQAVSAEPCADEVRIAQLEAEVNRLNTELSVTQARLIDCLESKIPASYKTTTTTAKAATAPAKAPTTAVTKSASVPVSTITRNPSVGLAYLDGLREDGIFSFCVMANDHGGLHFPQKAIEKGVSFTSVELNHSKDGRNWIVEPTELMEGDYGLTVDGVFYVSDALITKVLQMEGITLQSLSIKAPFTKWAPKQMRKEGNYWRYKAL